MFSKYLDYLIESANKTDQEQIEKFIELMMQAYREERMVFVIGNGGSAANASHFAEDLSKGTLPHSEHPKRIRAISLTDNISFITALANDHGYDTIFEQQLKTFAKPGDYVIAISGSGNSPNIVKAVQWANDNGLVSIGVTGYNGGKLKEINKYSLHIELNDMCTAESIHSILFHYIVIEIQKRIKEDSAVL